MKNIQGFCYGIFNCNLGSSVFQMNLQLFNLCQFKSGVKLARRVGTDMFFHLLSTVVFHLKIRNIDLVPLMPDWCYKSINVRRFRKI